jgi:hypothetical protein
MGEFAKVIQPHLDAHGIEGPEELARRLREAGIPRGAKQVRGWMAGDPGNAGPRDVLVMERIFELSEKETDAVEEAFLRDVRAEMEATRKERAGDE